MIIALAGRRIDASEAEVARFPLENVQAVRGRIRRLLEARGARGVVASGACGADLLAHDEARSLGLRRVLVLPGAPALFRERSVTDRPGNWGPLFDGLVEESRRLGGLVELEALSDQRPQTMAYLDVNDAIIEQALALAAREPRDDVLAVGVWNGASRGEDDITGLFLDSARAAGIATAEVPTLD